MLILIVGCYSKDGKKLNTKSRLPSLTVTRTVDAKNSIRKILAMKPTSGNSRNNKKAHNLFIIQKDYTNEIISPNNNNINKLPVCTYETNALMRPI